jgi:cytochrome c-type biogenesis protein CcmH
MLKRAMRLTVLCVATVMMLGAGESRYERLGHELMCSCGCGQILLECNHVGCPDSAGMINELHAEIDSGASDVQVLQWFEAKYGAVILAAPMRGGFDDVAWIAPIAVFGLATIGTAGVVWVWKRRSAGLAGGLGGVAGGGVGVGSEGLDDAELRERIRRETEYR